MARPLYRFIGANKQGSRLRVALQPRSSRDEVVGIYDDRLKIRLKAPAVEGAANRALVEFVAKLLKISKTRVRLKHGQRSKKKVLIIEGISADELDGIMEKITAEPNA